MIQKVSNEKTISILENLLNKKADQTENKVVEKKAKEQVSKLEPAKKMDNKSMVSRGHKVLSATSAKVTDIGGPKKQIGSETSNSIWDSGNLEKLKNSVDNKEKTAKEREDINKLRKGMKQERLDEMVANLQDTDTRKTSTVNSMAPHAGSRYKTPKNAISIFDKGEFERVPEKTDGEKAAEQARKPRKKDNIRKNEQQSFSNKDMINKIFG